MNELLEAGKDDRLKTGQGLKSLATQPRKRRRKEMLKTGQALKKGKPLKKVSQRNPERDAGRRERLHPSPMSLLPNSNPP